jgi:serine O-acetyltransferase
LSSDIARQVSRSTSTTAVPALKPRERIRAALRRVWLFSPERLWLLSCALHRRGAWPLALIVKQVNTIVYRNSLAPAARVSPDVKLGHLSLAIVVHRGVTIGSRVVIWHNVTLTARTEAVADGEITGRIVLEDGVTIGTGAIVIAAPGTTLRIGSGAQIGAGAIVTEDVPAAATVVPAPSLILPADPRDDAAPSSTA